MSKTVLFQMIKFSLSIEFSFVWPIDRAQSIATTPSQSKPGLDGNGGVLPIPQSSRLIRPNFQRLLLLPKLKVDFTAKISPYQKGSIGGASTIVYMCVE